MIVKFAPSGKSFKGLSQYLSHDPKAPTSERVAWTHTLNLANDHVPSAVHEMYQTFLDAEALKEGAGVKRGGQPLQFPVKHLSLDWHPDDKPTREHMQETAEAFLRHMGWDHHQAVLYCHEDKAHDHVHVMLNAVHPETGLKLDEGLERRRASEWSLSYELQQEQVRCGQRLLDRDARQKAPTRDAWETMKEAEQQHAEAEAGRRTQRATDKEPDVEDGGVWKAFKTLQREEREAFFDGGKAAYKDARDLAFREVREAFREEWRDYYAAKHEGLDGDALHQMKADLTSRQNEVLVERRDQMSHDLREMRDGAYADLLSTQQAERATFAARLAMGEDATDVLAEWHAMRIEYANVLNDNDPLTRGLEIVAERQSHLREEFCSTGNEICAEASESRKFGLAADDEEGIRGETRAENSRVRDGIDLGAALGAAAIGGALTFGEHLFEGFLDDAPRPKSRQVEKLAQSEEPPRDLFAAAAAAARRHAEQEAEETSRNEWWDERRSRARD